MKDRVERTKWMARASMEFGAAVELRMLCELDGMLSNSPLLTEVGREIVRDRLAKREEDHKACDAKWRV